MSNTENNSLDKKMNIADLFLKSSFSERLREARIENDMTQKELAEKIGLSTATIIAYEKGQKVPTITVAMNMATEFNVSMDWICGLSDSKNGKEPNTYADIVNLLMLISDNINLEIETNEESVVLEILCEDDVDALNKLGDAYYLEATRPPDIFGDGMVEYTSVKLEFRDKEINRFIVEWKKMLRLYEQNIIDSDVFDLWIEKQIRYLREKPLKDGE